ncbi:lasso peptide biosynthesis B2 protein [Streptomyces sp. NPDC088745]|uniref:lasso peptide biosynthesis B2 protein n=1 Tax=Streptomyces sp. NPDC088745 TaxID=3365884 RepID=UPI00380F29DD
MASDPAHQRPPLLLKMLAATVLPVAIAVHRLPLRWLVTATGALRRLPPAEPAFAQNVHQAVHAVRPPWWGGRIACMEVSLATVLALALCGRRVHWVLGVRAAPNEAHAWVQGEAFTLGLENDDPVRPWTAALITPPPLTRKGE